MISGGRSGMPITPTVCHTDAVDITAGTEYIVCINCHQRPKARSVYPEIYSGDQHPFYGKNACQAGIKNSD